MTLSNYRRLNIPVPLQRGYKPKIFFIYLTFKQFTAASPHFQATLVVSTIIHMGINPIIPYPVRQRAQQTLPLRCSNRLANAIWKSRDPHRDRVPIAHNEDTAFRQLMVSLLLHIL